MDYQKVLVENLDLVARLVSFSARRHGLRHDNAEEFGAIVRFKLVDRHYAILRTFRGQSSLETYLAVVIERLCVDYCLAQTGKWHPSAAARRRGETAVILERLVYRDGLSVSEAVETLRVNYGVVTRREELHELFAALPTRTTKRMSGSDAVPLSVPVRSQTGLDMEDRTDDLAAALQHLTAGERQLLKFRFEEGSSVSEIARRIGMPRGRLARAFERVLAKLRLELSRADL